MTEEQRIVSEGKFDTIIAKMSEIDKKLTQIETRMELNPGKDCIKYMEAKFAQKSEIDSMIEEKKSKDENRYIRKTNVLTNTIELIKLLAIIFLLLLSLQNMQNSKQFSKQITEVKR